MWPVILSFGLKAIGWYLDKTKADKEIREAFLLFVEKIDKHQMGSRDINNSSRKQVADIIAKEKATIEKMKNAQ